MNNRWLYTQLRDKAGLYVSPAYHPLIIVEKLGIEYRIYTPNTDEYLITIDIVQKAKDMGANIISYPTSWCRASSEAFSYGKKNNLQVIPHGRLFELLEE